MAVECGVHRQWAPILNEISYLAGHACVGPKEASAVTTYRGGATVIRVTRVQETASPTATETGSTRREDAAHTADVVAEADLRHMQTLRS